MNVVWGYGLESCWVRRNDVGVYGWICLWEEILNGVNLFCVWWFKYFRGFWGWRGLEEEVEEE